MPFTAFGPVYKAAMSLLPAKLDSLEAKAQILAVAKQESHFDERRQIGGPARGFFQFELGGIKGVLNHPATAPLIRSVLDRLDYDYGATTSYVAIEHNDILAFCYARLNLYWLPQPLPKAGMVSEGWNQYIEAWRPGKPHRSTWDNYFNDAHNLVLAWSKQ